MPERMRAAVVTRYGPPSVVELREVDRPEPGAGEVLVRVVAAAVTSADARIRSATFPPGFALPARLGLGLRRPRRAVLGASLSGEVVAVGSAVDGFVRGDRVCGMTGTSLGTHAEYASVPAARLVQVPPEVSHDEAAGLLFGGTTARFFLGRAEKARGAIGPGTQVLINGASGAVGTSAIQLAARAGAVVTAVTRAENAALVERLGAHDTIDHMREDLLMSGRRFDVALDAVGNLDIAGARRLLSSDGVLLLTTPSLLRTIVPRRGVITGTAPERAEDFAALLGMVAAGTLEVVHEVVGTLDDVAAAYARVDSGRKVGNLIVRPRCTAPAAASHPRRCSPWHRVA